MLTIRTVASVVGVAALLLAGPSRATAAEPVVEVKLFRFGPGTVEVKPGTRVTWTNADDIGHTVTSGLPERPDGRFARPLPARGARTSVEFKEPGAYPYFCDRHPSMRGEIRVH